MTIRNNIDRIGGKFSRETCMKYKLYEAMVRNLYGKVGERERNWMGE